MSLYWPNVACRHLEEWAIGLTSAPDSEAAPDCLPWMPAGNSRLALPAREASLLPHSVPSFCPNLPLKKGLGGLEAFGRFPRLFLWLLSTGSDSARAPAALPDKPAAIAGIRINLLAVAFTARCSSVSPLQPFEGLQRYSGRIRFTSHI